MTLMLARFLLLHRAPDPLPCEARGVDEGPRFCLLLGREGGRHKVGRRGRARFGERRKRAEIVRRSGSPVRDRPAWRLLRACETSAAPARRARRVPLLLLALLTITSLMVSSCASSAPDVSGRWTGGLALNYGSGYDVELNLVQDGEDLSGTGALIARDAGEDDISVDVAEGSRVSGEEIDLILRDASGYANLRIDLQGAVEEERIDAEGTFRGSNGVAQSGLEARVELTPR